MKKILFVFVGIAASAVALAQGIQLERSVLASDGHFASGTGISVEFTVGQSGNVNMSTGGSTTFMLTQGFQQSKTSPVGINDLNISLGDVMVYPNPAVESFSVIIKYPNPSSVKLTLYNVLGQPVASQSDNITHPTTETLNVTGVSAGIYLLEIAIEDNGKIYKSTRKVNIIN